jgi:hypothetical protein
MVEYQIRSRVRGTLMNGIVRRPSDSLNHASGWAPSTRLERAIQNEVDLVQGRAIVQAARVKGVEYVTYTALQAVEGLTNMEMLALQRNPLGDARYKAIVDTATMSLARIVTETGQG